MSDQRFLQYLANIRLLAPWEITAAQQQVGLLHATLSHQPPPIHLRVQG